jgi:hypothetical protein
MTKQKQERLKLKSKRAVTRKAVGAILKTEKRELETIRTALEGTQHWTVSNPWAPLEVSR